MNIEKLEGVKRELEIIAEEAYKSEDKNITDEFIEDIEKAIKCIKYAMQDYKIMIKRNTQAGA